MPPTTVSDAEIVLEVEEGAAGQRLDRYLTRHIEGVSRSQVQKAIRLDLVTVDGVVAWKTGLALKGGEELFFQPPPVEPLRAEPQAIPLDVLYEDGAVTVVNKAAGMVVHPAAGHPDSTLVNALLGRDPDLARLGLLRPGIVHRLDKGTSGAMVVARTPAAREALAQQFLDRTVTKGYLALVHGVPKTGAGVIDAPLDRHPVDRKRFTSRTGKGRHALTRWRVAADGNGLALLAVRILTGRTHQIRVHLADAGFPIVGDDTYGPPWRKALRHHPGIVRLAPWLGAGPMLHAGLLVFAHPDTGKPLPCSAPLPARFVQVLDALMPGVGDEVARAMNRPAFYDGDAP